MIHRHNGLRRRRTRLRLFMRTSRGRVCIRCADLRRSVAPAFMRTFDRRGWRRKGFHEGPLSGWLADRPFIRTSVSSVISCLRATVVAGALDQRQDVRAGGAAGVHDEVRVDGRDHRAAFGRTLEAGVFDQPAGEVAGRVLEDRSARRRVEWLRVLPARQERIDLPADALGVGGFDLEERGDHDVARCASERRDRYAKSNVGPRACARARSVRREDLDFDHRVADLALADAGVHRDPSAEAARDPRAELEARKAALATEARQARMADAGLREDAMLRVLELLEPAQFEEHPVDAFVRDEQVEAPSDRATGKAVGVTRGDEPREFVAIRRRRERIRRSAHAQRGEALRVRIEADAVAEHLAKFALQGRGNHDRASSAASSCGPSCVMLPAPRARTLVVDSEAIMKGSTSFEKSSIQPLHRQTGFA